MTDIFKSDALLYLAFTMVGFAAIAPTFWDKVFCTLLSVLILVVRSFVKKYLYKE